MRAQLFVAKLTDVLGQHPPPQPSRPAVDLLVTVGQQQEYLLFHNLLPPPGHPGALDALQARIIPYTYVSATNFMAYSIECLSQWWRKYEAHSNRQFGAPGTWCLAICMCWARGCCHTSTHKLIRVGVHFFSSLRRMPKDLPNGDKLSPWHCLVLNFDCFKTLSLQRKLSADALTSAQVFGPHVTRWIDGSQAALCARCRQLEHASGGFVGHAERLPEGADGAGTE